MYFSTICFAYIYSIISQYSVPTFNDEVACIYFKPEFLLPKDLSPLSNSLS